MRRQNYRKPNHMFLIDIRREIRHFGRTKDEKSTPKLQLLPLHRRLQVGEKRDD